MALSKLEEFFVSSIRVVALLVIMHADKIRAKKKKQPFLIKLEF
jgi:hypothetical protein